MGERTRDRHNQPSLGRHAQEARRPGRHGVPGTPCLFSPTSPSPSQLAFAFLLGPLLRSELRVPSSGIASPRTARMHATLRSPRRDGWHYYTQSCPSRDSVLCKIQVRPEFTTVVFSPTKYFCMLPRISLPLCLWLRLDKIGSDKNASEVCPLQPFRFVLFPFL